jgi:hypothetical protein
VSAWDRENEKAAEQSDPATNEAFDDLTNPAAILYDLCAFIADYVALPTAEALWASTLWVAHTHFAEHFETTPRLVAVSPEKQCGKTRLLEVFELVCARPRAAVNTSPAAMFRLVEMIKPTLLFDEADTYFGPRAREHEELRGLVNAGHRKGARAWRCVGDPKRMEVHDFPAYCAVALAAIGDLPDTIVDRAVVLRMRRRRSDERIRSFRLRHARPPGVELHDRLALWAKLAGEWVGQSEPELPGWLENRPADVWEPLIALADAAGGDWPTRARQAARVIEADRARADVSLGVRLLADIRTTFAAAEKMFTTKLLEKLRAIDDAPWGNLRGKPLDDRGLARRLRKYDVRPKTIWIGLVSGACQAF